MTDVVMAELHNSSQGFVIRAGIAEPGTQGKGVGIQQELAVAHHRGDAVRVSARPANREARSVEGPELSVPAAGEDALPPGVVLGGPERPASRQTDKRLKRK